MTTSYDDFFETFDGGDSENDGNQTDIAVDTEREAEESTQDDTQQGQGEPEGGETAEESNEDEAEEVPAEGEPGPDNSGPEQKFTIKVNKQTRELTLAQMTELAQKGADYDRIRGRYDESEQNVQGLQEKLDAQQPLMDIVSSIASDAGMEVPAFLEQVRVNVLMQKGMTEKEAKATIRAQNAEKALNDATPAQKSADNGDTAPDRAAAEIEEFARAFPGVQLTQEQIDKLMPDVQAGMTLTNAYLKMENARLAAALEAKQKSEKAESKNRTNRMKAPRSQRDSGGQNTKDAYEDFFAAFEK